jgi:hypothetical protein
MQILFMHLLDAKKCHDTYLTRKAITNAVEAHHECMNICTMQQTCYANKAVAALSSCAGDLGSDGCLLVNGAIYTLNCQRRCGATRHTCTLQYTGQTTSSEAPPDLTKCEPWAGAY